MWEVRINKKMPATTMVLEWSRAETGVGPSMAAGSQGWKPNWADFPAAARTRAMARMSEWSGDMGTSWASRVRLFRAIHEMLASIPISARRL